ncbi:MAG: peptidoglycan DD-metalloendopeptidase family protein [Peptococcaceae bacterium]|nr:peptidoglycan DD-metalloendopeptidase family protein [Peptococcaceae bacterium]
MEVQTFRRLERWMMVCVGVLALAGLMVMGLALPLNAATADELNKRLQDIRNNQSSVSSELTVVKSKIQGTEAEIEVLTAEIKESEKLVASKEKEHREAVTKVDDAKKRVEAKQAEVAERQSLMRVRARAEYEEGKTGTLGMLLQADSFSDLLSRVEYLKCLDNKDNELLEDLQARQKELEEEQANLTIQMKAAEALKEEAIQAKNVLDQKNKDLASSLNTYQGRLDELNKQDKEMEAEAQRIYAQLQTQSSQVTVTPGNGTLTHWPVPTQQSVYSGYRTAARPNHNGIDISTYLGTRIVAAGNGRVILVRRCGHKDYCSAACSYGNYIIIDHGNGLTTLYAHLRDAYLPANGADVQGGQLVAYMGSTGNSTGPHLHFEVRKNGIHVNPMNYRSQMK